MSELTHSQSFSNSEKSESISRIEPATKHQLVALLGLSIDNDEGTGAAAGDLGPYAGQWPCPIPFSIGTDIGPSDRSTVLAALAHISSLTRWM